MRGTGRALAAIAIVLCGAGAASADPYRLRADSFASAEPTVGLIVLQAEARRPSIMDAEGLVWVGAGDRPGDVMVISVGVRDPEGRAEARFGRMLVTTGAIRPVHLDGAIVSAGSPTGARAEVFGGMPVEPSLGPRSFDWVVGQRLSTRIEDLVTVGMSYVHRRDEGRLAFEELGLDGWAQPLPWLDTSVIVALDTIRGDATDASARIAARRRGARLELFAARRSPSRLLPSTSLFAALGDVPSSELGLSGFWRAAPRLDLSATATAESIGGEPGAAQTARALLRLDDRGDGSLGVELRRQSAPDASWTGARLTARVPLGARWAGSTELELAVPDHGGARGSIWPWGLVAVSCLPAPRLELAGAIEASSSPTAEASLGALLRLTGRWDEQ
ncbi:MAG: hypothetical protein IT372_23485 [Polyangiaceae bacterium]|nr:hypothetical protein [Polyangiaceae bacterium]